MIQRRVIKTINITTTNGTGVAYAAGDAFGAKFTLTNIFAEAPTGIWRYLGGRMADADAMAAGNWRFMLFGQNYSDPGDNNAFTLATDAEYRSKLMCAIEIGSTNNISTGGSRWYPCQAMGIAASANQNALQEFQSQAATAYAQLVTIGTPTATSVSALNLVLSFELVQ